MKSFDVLVTELEQIGDETVVKIRCQHEDISIKCTVFKAQRGK